MKLTPKPKQRILVMSDIHGNRRLFKTILATLNFSKKDILIINGDMSEKGPDSIGLFREIIALQKTHSVYATLGNCDELLLFLNDDQRDKGMEHYMMNRKNTILSEFLKAYGPYTTFQNLKQFAQKNYQDIFSFVASLPLKIETPYFDVVHAGINPLEPNNRDFMLKAPAFMNHDFEFSKPLIVGHYPVCLYSDTHINHNPILNRRQNIFAIDGGNTIKTDGQINVLELIDDTVISHRFDDLKYQSMNRVQTRVDGIHLSWVDREITILEKGTEFSLCKHISSNTSLNIHNHFIDFESETLIYDYTNALVEVKENDVVHVFLEASSGYYIKCNGAVGWLLK